MADWNGSGYIVKIVVLMKISHHQKNIFGLLANIRAFITVVNLKNTEILKYQLILIQALQTFNQFPVHTENRRWRLLT